MSLAVNEVKNIDAATLLFFGTQADIDAWRQNAIESERLLEQRLDVTNYDNYSQHEQINEVKYIQSGCTNHVNSYAVKKIILSSHYRVGYSRASYGASSYSAGAYSRSCSQHSNGGGGYSQSHANHSNHSNHSNYSRCSNYSQYSQHTNTGVNDHVNCSQSVCNDGILVKDLGFNHQNFIPSKPKVFELSEDINASRNLLVTGTYNLEIASYDKNVDGAGSTDADSKTQLYDVTIQKVKDRAGNSVSSEVVALAANSTANKVSIDSFNPLGATASKEDAEGIYEITIVAKNAPKSYTGTVTKNGVVKSTETVSKTYESQTTVVYMTVDHDTAPKVNVINASEFNGANFGLDGKYLNNIFKAWGETHYNGAGESQQEGLLVQISLTDVDADYHKGYLYLKDTKKTPANPNDDEDLTNKVAITWISDESGNKTGYAFIPKSQFLDDGNRTDISVVIEVDSFIDAAKTVLKGRKYYYTNVSEGGNAMLVNIDVDRPEVIFTPGTPQLGIVDVDGVNNKISIGFADSGLGIRDRYYQIIKSSSLTGEENYNPNDWVYNPSDITITVDEEAHYMIWGKVVDNSGNVTITKSGVYKIAPINLEALSNPVFPEKIYRRDKFTVLAISDTLHNIVKAEAWIDGFEATTKMELTTTDVGRSKRWEGDMVVPATIPEGDHKVIVKVYTDMANNNTIYSKQASTDVKFVEAPASTFAGAEVSHTTEWEIRRTKYNKVLSGNPELPRSKNTFWAGEKILLNADIGGIVSKIEGFLVEAPEYQISNINYDINPTTKSIENVTAELYDETMRNKWGRTAVETLTLRMTVTYFDGETRTLDLPINFDSGITYLSGLEVVNKDEKLIADVSDPIALNAGEARVYALNNISNMATIKLHSVDFIGDARTVKFELSDTVTGNVVRTMTDSIKFNQGDTQEGAEAYTMPWWWVDGDGKYLPSGIYTLKATIVEGETEFNSIECYIMLKTTRPETPKISYENKDDKVEVSIKYFKDTFLENIFDALPSGAIKTYVGNLITEKPTKYETMMTDAKDKSTTQVFTPSFNGSGEWTALKEITTTTTFVASTKDMFGNTAQVTQTILFGGGLISNPNIGVGSPTGGSVSLTTVSAPINTVETPSAKNFFVGTSKKGVDEIEGNPFGFLGGGAPEESED